MTFAHATVFTSLIVLLEALMFGWILTTIWPHRRTPLREFRLGSNLRTGGLQCTTILM